MPHHLPFLLLISPAQPHIISLPLPSSPCPPPPPSSPSSCLSSIAMRLASAEGSHRSRAMWVSRACSPARDVPTDPLLPHEAYRLVRLYGSVTGTMADSVTRQSTAPARNSRLARSFLASQNPICQFRRTALYLRGYIYIYIPL